MGNKKAPVTILKEKNEALLAENKELKEKNEALNSKIKSLENDLSLSKLNPNKDNNEAEMYKRKYLKLKKKYR